MESPVVFSQWNVSQIPKLKKILQDFEGEFSDTTNTNKILEIGCGSGSITKKLLVPYFKRCQCVVAVDISEEAIQFARENNSDKNIVYEVLDIAGDLSRFKEKWHSFQRIVSFLCLHWVYDWEKAIANISELLSDNGECLLHFVTESYNNKMWRINAKSSRWDKYMKDVSCVQRNRTVSWEPSSECQRLMRENGMDVLNFEEADYETNFDDVDSLKRLLQSIDPFISRIPEEERELYMEDSVTILRSFPHFERTVGGQTKYALLSKKAVVRAKKNN